MKEHEALLSFIVVFHIAFLLLDISYDHSLSCLPPS